MGARATKVAGTNYSRPFLVVVDVELPEEKPRRNEVATRRTFDAARSLAVTVRDQFDEFFGEYGDYFVIRVIDLRDMTVRFEYN